MRILSFFQKECKYFNLSCYCLIACSILTRIYQYIFHKDLWLDEAMLAFSMYGVEFRELFFAPLPNVQSAPLLFLVLSKIIGSFFDYNEYGLYLLPFICGILTLILGFKIAKILFGDNSFGMLVFVTLICGSLALCYYTTEFKQYGIEAFVGFLLFFLYLKKIDFKYFIAISIICMLLSHTGIFISCAIILGQIKFKPLKDFIKNNYSIMIFGAILMALFLLYYVLYIRFQTVDNFYDDFARWFIPLNPLDWGNFLTRILPVYNGFTIFNAIVANVIYIMLSYLGLYSLCKKRHHIFDVCIIMLCIYVALSVLKIYPFGVGEKLSDISDNILGRLSMYMSVFFYVICAFGVVFIYEALSQRLKYIALFLLAILSCWTIIANTRMLIYNTHFQHQTSDFIYQLSQEYVESSDNKKCVFVYYPTQFAFLYYQYLNKVNIPYNVFEEEDLIKSLDESYCKRNWLLISGFYINQDWYFDAIGQGKFNDLEGYIIHSIKKYSKNMDISYNKWRGGGGRAMFIRFWRD